MSKKRLWAPWRLGYISQTRKAKVSSKCLFCEKGKSNSDIRNLVIARGRFCFCLLNLFPYTNGHTMIVPYRHVADLGSLKKEECLELFELAHQMMKRMRRSLAPHGYNLGINLGRAAGAGIPGHLHLHVVPRWVGDTNFMPIFSSTRIISQSLDSAHKLLRRRS